MKIAIVEATLGKLAELIGLGRFAELETEKLEIKPVPAEGSQWGERYKSINAFLNTQGGILILGVKEEGQGNARRYVLSGWHPHAEPKLKELPKLFTDRQGNQVDLADCFPAMEVRDLLGGRVAVLYVDELAADRKFAFYRGTAYRRILTGDHRISDADVERQEEFKQEAAHARELLPVAGATIDDLDLDKLNEYIIQLNQPVKVESIKADLASARPFLDRKCFLKDGNVTLLGMLVCGRHPSDHLGFRAQVHCYVDVPQEVARDKQDLVDNILPLMEGGRNYILRNIQVGVSMEQGGTMRPQYPEELIREMVNNALAHRDYSINRQVIIAIQPGLHVAIHNPGAFRKHLVMEDRTQQVPLLRIIPESKPRNPKLADVLRVYRKWEGRGIGMATLVNLCLQNRMDLPYYRLKTEEVELYLCAGELLDERIEHLLQSFDGYIEDKLHGGSLSEPQKLVLAYLIKSEWANEQVRYTVLLTPDNNHFNELLALERAGLIEQHLQSSANYPIYVADRALMVRTYLPQLRALFGPAFDKLDDLRKGILEVLFRFSKYSRAKVTSARQTSRVLWSQKQGGTGDIDSYETFNRRVRSAFTGLAKAGFLIRQDSPPGFVLNGSFQKPQE